ncbi:MAG TPA: hypothetical protein VK019_01190 [Pseudomonas sp.]|nr:hypothetical protein [Pseudomonas sp.]
MRAWRALTMLALLLMLQGCLVTFREPLPASEAAPIPLLGTWQGEDDWGEDVFLSISRVGNHQYRAVRTEGAPDNLEGAEEYGFTVARHGRRWYLSAGLPRRLGGNFAILGFELTRGGELVLFNLDVERLLREVENGHLAGKAVETAEGEGVLIESSLDAVFGYLDDPAHAGVFIEVARLRRVEQ